MDLNSDRQVASGSSEKLLPTAPQSTSPYPPDISDGGGGQHMDPNMAAAQQAAAANSHNSHRIKQAEMAAHMVRAFFAVTPNSIGDKTQEFCSLTTFRKIFVHSVCVCD